MPKGDKFNAKLINSFTNGYKDDELFYKWDEFSCKMFCDVFQAMQSNIYIELHN